MPFVTMQISWSFSWTQIQTELWERSSSVSRRQAKHSSACACEGGTSSYLHTRDATAATSKWDHSLCQGNPGNHPTKSTHRREQRLISTPRQRAREDLARLSVWWAVLGWRKWRIRSKGFYSLWATLLPLKQTPSTTAAEVYNGVCPMIPHLSGHKYPLTFGRQVMQVSKVCFFCHSFTSLHCDILSMSWFFPVNSNGSFPFIIFMKIPE